MTHTPTPWTAEPLKKSSGTLRAYINAGLTNICGVSERHMGTTEALANAAFIVRCCNNHNQLVNLLELCEPFLRNAKGAHIIHADLIIALAAAKGGA